MTSEANPVPPRLSLYIALVQFIFTLCWTIYVIYLPKLAAEMGIPASAVILLLMMDQAIFCVTDFLTGLAADRVSKTIGRLGSWVAGATLLSCAAFVALPYVAGTGPAAKPFFIAVTILWVITSSALRAPPIMLLGKYAARPAVPLLMAIVMLGYGIAGAVAPFLGVALRDVDVRLPFIVSSVALALTTFGLIAVERALARYATPSPPSSRMPGTVARTAMYFVGAVVVLAIGYQLHSNFNSTPLYLRFARREDLQYLLPVFWVGFNIGMFPASLLTKNRGGLAVIAGGALVGAAAFLAADVADALDMLILAQFLAGAAWGAVLMSAVSAALAIGEKGFEGRVVGLVFSALALATFARMAAVATGMGADPAYAVLLRWAPVVFWALAAVAFVALAVSRARAAPAVKASVS